MLQLKIEQRIDDYMKFLDKEKYQTILPLDWKCCKEDKTHHTPPDHLDWQDISLPHPYGEEYTSFWFRAETKLPQELRKKNLFLYCQPQSDTLVFMNNKPLGAVNLHHERIRLGKIENGELLLHLEAYSGHIYPGCHPIEGPSVVLTLGKTIPNYPNYFLNGELQEKIEEVYDLYYDVRVLFESAKLMDKNSLLKAEILQGLYDALIKIPRLSKGKELQKFCADARKEIKPLLQRQNGTTAPDCHLIGHAHLDHAWLWPIAETHKKVARTFANMCNYAEEFPEFIFLQTQPCQLESVKERYPEIFDKIIKTYENGQWEPNGGMWVEADCNIPSGESLIRQFMYGRKVVEKEFPEYVADTLWLPDVFGYSAALPMIMKGCGIKQFITSKINWNDTTKFPYDKFVWEGVDGSKINTMFILDCFGGYNGSTAPDNIVESWNNCQHMELQNTFIKPIGEGDGGGGTHRSDIEMARRQNDLQGMPMLSWKKVSEAAEIAFQNEDKLPKYQGELYLELHRGTYTSQANTKKNNRKLELHLAQLEALLSFYYMDKNKFLNISLDDFWKEILTYQFHDIIPGSCIHKVYSDCDKAYAELHEKMADVEKDIITELTEEGTEKDVVVFNTTGVERRCGLVLKQKDFPFKIGSVKFNEDTMSVQEDITSKGEHVYYAPLYLEAAGWTQVTVCEEKVKGVETGFRLEGNTLTTPFYEIEFSEQGGIKSITGFDEDYQYVAEGQELNSFILAEDTPIFWDAWDIDADYRLKEKRGTHLISREIISNGQHLIRIRFTYKLGEKSLLEQDVICYSDSERIDFVTGVDWQERRHLLKVAFPVNIKTNESIADIQFGHIKRPTHENNMADRARFEICGHKWMALTDGKHTAAVLNDCKYGWDVKDSNIRLSLLKAAEAPDETADLGKHTFTYSFLPSDVIAPLPIIVEQAVDLNNPVKGYVKRRMELDSFASFFTDNEGVIVETVKPSEDKKGIIYRITEIEGASEECSFNLFQTPQKVELTNMLEDHIEDIDFKDNKIKLNFRPHEVKTLKITF